MPHVNHGKICKQKRIAFEERNRDVPHFSWVVPGFKKYPNLTWPEIALTDIDYCFYMANRPWLFGKVAAQARIVDNYARHILPPRPSHGRDFAIIINAKGVFEDVLVLPKSASIPKLKKGSNVILRMPHLDIGIVTQLANPRLGSKRMIECLNKLYFPHVNGNPGPSDCQAFFFDDSHFDPTCRQMHRLPPEAANEA
jgi:hypothetical protein